MSIGAIIGLAIGGILFILAIVTIFVGIRVVPQTSVYVVERLGSYKKTLKNGINFIIPFVDRIVLKETLKERVLDFPAQDVITKDNVTMKIDTVVYMQVTDPKLYAYGVERPIFAIENLTATTLRNLVGDLELDQTLTSRDSVNEKLRSILDDATDPWGVKVIRVELKNILPPEDIRRAMEKQMRAEREKRQQILVAEGEKQAAILRAEGNKRSAILKAEGARESKILNAEGTKKSLELINASKPTKEALVIKGYDALMQVSKGEATTILLPSELTEITTIAATFGAVNSKTKSSTTKKAKTTKKKVSVKDAIESVTKSKNK